MKNKSEGTASISFLSLLAIAFIVLKLTHNIDWPWLWVLAPLWAPLAVLTAIIVVCFTVYAVCEIINRVIK